MSVKIYYYTRLNGHTCWDVFFVDELKKSFEDRGYEVELFHKNEWPLVNGDANSFGLKRCIIVDIGSKFFIINHHDRYYSFLAIKDQIINHKDCIAIFQCQYREAPHPKVLPFTYLEQHRGKYIEYKKELGWNPKSKILHCRTNIHSRDGRKKRRHLIPLLEDIITPCLTVHPDDSNLDIPRPMMETVDMKTFMTELTESYLALATPGTGNFCHRELECFGLGVPVLMPRLINVYYDPLIPDYHYVSVDCNWEKDSDEFISQAIRRRYHEVIDNMDILKKVSKNAKAWHEKNVDGFFHIIEENILY